jgi:hypothetical protein
VAELVVEVPDALLQRLRLRSRRRRLPSHLIRTIRSSPLERDRERLRVEQEGRGRTPAHDGLGICFFPFTFSLVSCGAVVMVVSREG